MRDGIFGSDGLGTLSLGVDLDKCRNLGTREGSRELLVERRDLLARTAPVRVDCA